MGIQKQKNDTLDRLNEIIHNELNDDDDIDENDENDENEIDEQQQENEENKSDEDSWYDIGCNDENENDENNINDLLEGDAILAGTEVGIIRYLGPLYLNPRNMADQSDETYIGIECSKEIDAERGGNDGWYRDFRYFQTKQGKQSGLLVKASKFSKKLSPWHLLQTIKKQKIATDKLQKSIKTLKAENKLLRLNLEALLSDRHKMKRFLQKMAKSKSSNENETVPTLQASARKSTDNKRQNIKLPKAESIDIGMTELQHSYNPTSPNEENEVSVDAPQQIMGIKQRSIHAIDPSVQISEAMQQMAMTNQINSTTDHMLDSMSNEQQQRYYQPQTGQNIHHSATNSVGSMATAPQFMQSHSSSTAGYPAA